jgi:hypothetical protein
MAKKPCQACGGMGFHGVQHQWEQPCVACNGTGVIVMKPELPATGGKKSDVLYADPSEPIEQFLLGSRQHKAMLDRLFAVYLEVRKGTRNIVGWHKERLGKQDFTWKGSEFHFYVWERPTWRVFVAKGKGICIEVKGTGDRRQRVRAAKAALAAYLAEVGMG